MQAANVGLMYSKRASIRLLGLRRWHRVSTRRHWNKQYATSTASTPAIPTSKLLPSEADIQAAREHCISLLKKYDTPSYTLIPFLPRDTEVRNTFIALHALNITLALIPETVSTPQIGTFRYQFWQDVLNSAFPAHTPSTASSSPVTQSKPLPSHPIATLLSTCPKNLSRSFLNRLLQTRQQRLQNPPFTTLTSLESYAENTSSTMLYLLLQSHPSNNPFPSLTADHLASHVGKACGIVNILRGVPLLAFPPPPNHHSNNPSGASPLGRGGAGLGGVQDSLGGRKTPGFVNLPLDVMADANLREEDVLRQGASAPGLKDAVFRVATRASDHLITTRTMLGNLRKGEDVGHDFEYEGVEGYADYGHDAEYAGLSREESGRSKGRRFDSDAYRQEVLGGEMDATFNNFGDDASSISSTPAQTGRKVAGRGVSKEQKQLQEVETLFPFLLPGVAAQLWLERLEKVDFDVFDPSLRRSDWKLPWRYWRANSKKKI